MADKPGDDDDAQGKFLALFLALFALTGLSSAFVAWTVSAQKDDARAVNLAGAQRMLSQKMTKEALLRMQGRDTGKALQASAQRFDRVLKGLIEGDAELGLARCDDPQVLAALARVGEIWGPFHAAVDRIAASAAKDAATIVVDNNAALLDRANAAVTVFETRAAERSTVRLYAQTSVITLVALMLVGSWFLIIAPVVKRLGWTTASLLASAQEVLDASEQITGASQALAKARPKKRLRSKRRRFRANRSPRWRTRIRNTAVWPRN